jgi:hypothetical protein
MVDVTSDDYSHLRRANTTHDANSTWIWYSIDKHFLSAHVMGGVDSQLFNPTCK